MALVIYDLGGRARPPPVPNATAAVKIPQQKGSTLDAWLMILAIAVIGVVLGRLLYELNPSLWESAAARVEDDTPPDGAIDDYLERVEAEDESD